MTESLEGGVRVWGAMRASRSGVRRVGAGARGRSGGRGAGSASDKASARTCRRLPPAPLARFVFQPLADVVIVVGAEMSHHAEEAE